MKNTALDHSADYNHIIDGIYIGTNRCCQTHLDEILIKEGISVDISLEADHVDDPYGADAYLWLPVEDLKGPTQDQLDIGVAFLDKIVAQKRRVYVHCRLGHGRSPTLVAAYLVSRGATVDVAIQQIKAARPPVHLEPDQMNALQAFSVRRGRI